MAGWHLGNDNLTRKIFLALGGVFLVFVVVRGALLYWEYERALERAQQRAENLSLVMAENLNRTFGAIESAVNQLVVHSNRIGGPQAGAAAWAEVLDATLSGLSGVGSLNVLDADGYVVLSTTPDVTGTSRRGRYLHRHLGREPGDTLVIGPAAPAEHVSGIRIPIGRALHDARGRFIGFIAATFQPERLRGFYRAVNVGSRGAIRLFHGDGKLLFSEPYNGRAGRTVGDAAAIGTALSAGRANGTLTAPVDSGGEDYTTAWRALAYGGTVIAVSLARRDALADWRTEVITVGASALGMLLLLLPAGVWIAASGRMHTSAVAERNLAGAALRRSQAQFQAVIDHSPSGIVLKDRDGRFLVANRKILEWLALPEAEVLGRTAAELFGPEIGRHVAEHDHLVATVGDVLSREFTMTFPDGTRRRIVTTHFPVRLGDDAAVFIGGILTDVTTAHEVEEKLRQAQKMEAIGQLTGGVAHDFNNMLTAIMGNIQFLRRRVGDDEEARRYLEAAMRAAKRSTDLTSRLLTFSRRQPMAPVSTDLNRLVTDCRALLQRTIGASIGIEAHLGKDAWPALVDPGQLENALLNLAINARDAMPDGGTLTIETANVTLDAHDVARNPDVVSGPHVMIAVSDTGTGIAPELLPRVFEPFFTTKPTGAGTGLGLSMVYGFAKQSGGHASIYSEVGIGTTVRLFLPRSADAAIYVGDGAAVPAEDPRGTENILVIEDNPDVADFVVRALESLGYTVRLATDGPEALAMLRERGPVDLILTDVSLPNGMNGREVMEKVWAGNPDTRVVFMSGYAESIIVHQGQLQEHLDFLPKPFARDTLARKIRSVLDAPRSPTRR